LGADITIFDPNSVGSPERAERRYDLPGGAKRMVMPSLGIRYTIVNGSICWKDGEIFGRMNGRVLRS